MSRSIIEIMADIKAGKEIEQEEYKNVSLAMYEIITLADKILETDHETTNCLRRLLNNPVEIVISRERV